MFMHSVCEERKHHILVKPLMDKIIVKNKKVYFVKIKNFMRTTPKSIFIEKTTVFYPNT